jgi:hypothetical protein
VQKPVSGWMQLTRWLPQVSAGIARIYEILKADSIPVASCIVNANYGIV